MQDFKPPPSPVNGSPVTRVLLVDDHAVVRAGLAALINCERDLVTCGEAENERAAIDAVRTLRPDVAVVDWSLRNRDAMELVETLKRDHPKLPVLVLSVHDEVFYAGRAIQAGASGYVMKQEATDRIINAIRQVATGGRYLTQRAEQALAGETGLRGGEPAAAGVPHRPVDPFATTPGDVVSVSVVIPVYNSQATIARLTDALIAELNPTYRLQIVLVDDGSRDESPAVCAALHQRHPEIVDCVLLARNFGEHNAVIAGLNCAEGDYTVIMDDDFQNPPAEVHKLIDEIKKGHDVVYVRYPNKRHSSFRNLGSYVHNWMATRALGKPADLYLSSFKALSRFVVREIAHYTGPDPYLDAIVLRTTRKIGVVTSRHEPRNNGRSGYTLKKLISLWGNMVVAFSLYPVRVLGIYGIVMTLVGVTYGLITLVAYFSPAIRDPDTYQWMNASNWFLRGVTLLFLSIIAEYVGRIYMQMNRDPQFIVRHVMRRQSKG